MEDINQTKEGFIKSMVLFMFLLVICFTPFLAFSDAVSDHELKLKPETETSVKDMRLWR